MGTFVTDLNAKLLPFKRETIQLLSPLRYVANDGRIIEAPTGFISDGVSVPTLFWWLASPLGINARAGVLHDLLYTMQATRQLLVPGDDPDFGQYITLPCSQKQADDYFFEMSIACGTNTILAHAEWSQLRLWGWTHWTRATVELAEKVGTPLKSKGTDNA